MNLNLILKGASAIPYSEELISILMTACNSYKGENDFVRIDELIVTFVTGNIPVTFKDYIRTAMKEEDFYEEPTDEVFVRLAQYVVLNTIFNNENKLNRAIYASKMMNYMLVAKALKHYIPNTEYIQKAYNYHISKYLCDTDMLTEEAKSVLRSTVPYANFPLQISENDANDLRLAFKEATLYRIERLLTSDLIQKIDNPFTRIYVGLSKMFENLPYLFYNLDVKRIVGLLDKDEKKRKKLSNIIDDILNSDYKFDQDYSETSVILSMINGKKQEVAGDLMLSQKEFAIYLYYELLIEKIIYSINI